MERNSECSVFEYLYRDAGNYKTHARVLLRGRAGPLHEFTALRPAQPDDIESLAAAGTVAQLAARFRATTARSFLACKDGDEEC